MKHVGGFNSFGTIWPDVFYLEAVTANSLVTGPGEEAGRVGRWGRHHQTVDSICVTFKHCLALPALDTQKENIELNESNIILKLTWRLETKTR